ncbi:dihydrolipoyl dehydrogenase family protein [Alkalicoccus chagannorensis]|uniref:dihydrolipoyl dehydrogenase family protein n=1 Tax=Alkalicoccus chagannorensis TaxID=427072 RepID=UPI0004201C1E|nr:NAD(P)/FAD-dependent oxidoreductase [Alkalicoccus chagannorensis]
MKTYDLIVVGGGSGGLSAAAGAARFGAETALIEKQPALGGDCLHFGCVPSKALIAAAKDVHQARSAAQKHGWQLEGEADWQAVRSQIQHAVDTIQEHDSTERFSSLGVDVIYAEAWFEDEHVIGLSNGTKLYGKKIIIAAGSSPVVPRIENMDQIDVLTNEQIFYLDKLPKRMVMAGGGPIGLEMAQSLSRLGVDVTVVEASRRLLGREDAEIAARAESALRRELTIYTGSSVSRVEQSDASPHVVIEGDTNVTLPADALFLAVGRKPNSDKLQASRAGVKLGEKGHIEVNSRMQSSVPHIYAVGDINGQFPFTHGAGAQAQTALANALFGLPQNINYDAMPWSYYTQPEIYHLGMTEAEVYEERGGSYQVLRGSGADRMTAEMDEDSFVKVIVDKSGYILGAHAVGAQASDWMQTLVYMKKQKDKISVLSSVTHPYPARTEIVKQTSDQYWKENVLEKPALKAITERYLRWFR